jgi:hypothetical protein
LFDPPRLSELVGEGQQVRFGGVEGVAFVPSFQLAELPVGDAVSARQRSVGRPLGAGPGEVGRDGRAMRPIRMA